MGKLLVVYGAIYAIQIINRLHDAVTTQLSSTSVVLGIVENAVSPLQGLANAFIYWRPLTRVQTQADTAALEESAQPHSVHQSSMAPPCAYAG